MGKNIQTETKLLKLSIWAMLGFSILGLIFGMLLSSSYILFDGIYSLQGVVLSFFSLRLSHFIRKKDHFNFPFGKESLEPGIIIIQYLVALILLVITFAESVYSILHGGNSLELGWTIVYIGITTIVVYVVYTRIRKESKGAYSPLLDGETKQWKLSLYQNIGVFIGYMIAQATVWLSYDFIVPYIEPAILIIVVILLIKTPIYEIGNALKELLGMRTVSEALYHKMEQSLEEICIFYDMKKFYLRVNKRGSIVFIEIDFLVDFNFEYDTIEHQDMIREKVEESLGYIKYDIWLTIAFTCHKKWAE